MTCCARCSANALFSDGSIGRSADCASTDTECKCIMPRNYVKVAEKTKKDAKEDKSLGRISAFFSKTAANGSGVGRFVIKKNL